LLWGCATVLDEDGALAIVPYELRDDGRIIVETRVNGQGPYAFALDTGASISVVLEHLQHELALEPVPGKLVRIHGAVASGSFALMSIDRVEVGRTVWPTPRIALMPGETAAGHRIDGILGVDFLRRYGVGFSTRDRVVRLYPPDLVGQRAYRGWVAVPLNPEFIGTSGNAIYYLDITIGDQRIPAMFDLGAGVNMINWPAARSLGVVALDPRDESLLSGAIESVSVVGRTEIDEVRTGRVRWQDEEFSIVELEVFDMLSRADTPCAILGAGLFTQRDFIIDFARNRLLVKVVMDEATVIGHADEKS
jgi:predicted aspartyl protease